MGEKTHFYILLSGEALIIQSQKQFEQLQDFNITLNKEIAAQEQAALGEVKEEFQEMNDDEFFSQQLTMAQRNTGLTPAQSNPLGQSASPLTDYQEAL